MEYSVDCDATGCHSNSFGSCCREADVAVSSISLDENGKCRDFISKEDANNGK